MINAVAEAQFKIIKTEFVRSRRFENLEHLKVELMGECIINCVSKKMTV